MTGPLERGENQLAVSRRHVVLRQDDSEEEEESLAVGGSQDCGGGQQGASTEWPAGQFVGQRRLTIQR